MEESMKEIFGVIGTGFMMAGYVPYLLALWRRRAKPHTFSWLLWGTINGIICAVQITQDAGPGAWAAGVAATFNIGIGLYAIRHGERNITRGDWAIFLTVLAALPLWQLTKDPMWSVILVSVIDTLAFIPTVRKSWHRPHEEVAMTFALGVFGFAFALMALKNYSFANVCYPAKVIVTNMLFVSSLMYRRRAVETACAA
jgi:hypothetical protein